MQLRPATDEDAEAVVRFWKDAAEDTDRADTVDGVRALIARDPDALVLAVDDDDGRIVGSVIAGWDGWRAHLYRLAVAPTQRRRGVGRTLLAAAEARLDALGAPRADAMVLDANALGRTIWAAGGYARQAEWARWVKAL